MPSPEQTSSSHDMAGDHVTTRVARIPNSRTGGDGEPPTSASWSAGPRPPCPRRRRGGPARAGDARRARLRVDEHGLRARPRRRARAGRAGSATAGRSRSAPPRVRGRGAPVRRRPAAVAWCTRPGSEPTATPSGAAYFREQGFTVLQAELADVAGRPGPGRARPRRRLGRRPTSTPTSTRSSSGGNGFRAARRHRRAGGAPRVSGPRVEPGAAVVGPGRDRHVGGDS